MKSTSSLILFLSGGLLTNNVEAKDYIVIEQDPRNMEVKRPMVDLPECKLCALDDEYN